MPESGHFIYFADLAILAEARGGSCSFLFFFFLGEEGVIEVFARPEFVTESLRVWLICLMGDFAGFKM